jgi:hypothetical protein
MLQTYLGCGGERGLMADIHLEEEGMLCRDMNLKVDSRYLLNIEQLFLLNCCNFSRVSLGEF